MRSNIYKSITFIPIYDHPKSKFESDHYKHLIINELAKIPSHEINTNDGFLYIQKIYSMILRIIKK